MVAAVFRVAGVLTAVALAAEEAALAAAELLIVGNHASGQVFHAINEAEYIQVLVDS